MRRIPSAAPRVALIGFMGAGKTTVGRLLARRMGAGYADLDDLVAARAGMSVAEIFRTLGETAFREQEAFALAAWLRDTEELPAVLGLGGGAIENSQVRTLLKEAPVLRVFHLDVPLDTALTRCRSDRGTVRPLLAEAEERYARRAEMYVTIGHTIPAEGHPQRVAADIYEHLGAGR